MTPLLTLIQQQEKEFDEKFPICGHCEEIADGYNDQPGIKSFHRQTIISLLEGEIERLVGMKRKEESCGNLVCGDNDCTCYDRATAFNEALDQQIEYYKSVLDGLKKSV